MLWRAALGSAPNELEVAALSLWQLGEQMMFDDIRRNIDQFLTGPMLDAFQRVDYQTPAYGCPSVSPADAFRAKVSVGHITGSPEARYRLHALGAELELTVQLNVYRLVVVYHIPATGALDCPGLKPRFERWEIGATNAGWKIGWRDAIDASSAHWVEVYCYAMLPFDFLNNAHHQLYWINDIVQMTRSLLLEAKRIDVRLPPQRRAAEANAAGG